MDAATGKMKWKWNEVPYSLWGNTKVNSGGGQWQPPTFDSAGHLYLEVANPAPWVGDKGYPGKKTWANGESFKSKALYTDSVVELNPANGKVMWHYQLTPHDIHDWDLNNQALITTVNGKETIISAGKAGIAIANDATDRQAAVEDPDRQAQRPRQRRHQRAGGQEDQEPALPELPGIAGRRRDPVRDGRHDRVLRGQQLPQQPDQPGRGQGGPVHVGEGLADRDRPGHRQDQVAAQLPELALWVGDGLQRPRLDGHVRRDAVGAEQEHRGGRLEGEAARRHQHRAGDRRRHRPGRLRVPARQEPEDDVRRLQPGCDGLELELGRVDQELVELRKRQRDRRSA